MGARTSFPQNVCGVYRIVNTKTFDCYVGSSSNVKVRWITHRSTLNNDKHANTALQAAWNKYGSNYFVFELLEQIDSKNLLVEREQHWMDSQLNKYNTSLIAARGGAKVSAEMLVAQTLLRQGLTAYAAAKQSGITQGAISKSAACQRIIAERDTSFGQTTQHA